MTNTRTLGILKKMALSFWWMIACAVSVLTGQEMAHPGSKIIFPIFWTWTDRQIEDRTVLREELVDIRQAGFGGVYAMPRATRYNLFDPEMTDAVRYASRLCRDNGLEFIWGPDPRFAATTIVRKTGYGAEMLMVNREYSSNLRLPAGADPSTYLLNEAKVAGSRYSLRYQYPNRRDAHMLTEVSLWLNPVQVEKVYAYQRKNGKVVSSSIRDITESHHFFINRSFYYVEVFGITDLPEGDWYVFAFPRFMTNMYAYDSPEHEQCFLTLLDEYKQKDIRFNGFWWDEPGYYFQFGHYAIGRFIYRDFAKQYGYDLNQKLYALVLDLDDDSQVRVRYDYFSLLMNYVFGGEQRLWRKGESLFGPLRMGIHQTWHWLPDDAYTGAGDVWKGLMAVDGGYTDEGNFERYFKSSTAERYADVSQLIIASSLAKFSRDRKAHFNQWGVQFENDVPVYWNDLMAAFSNEWLNHCYGYTGVLGADRSFGPGYPNHASWRLFPELNARNGKILQITRYNLPLAEVAVVYPNPTVITGWGPISHKRVAETDRLIGAMPALGIQADVVSMDLFASGELKGKTLKIADQQYKAVVLPHASVVTPECLIMLDRMQKAKFPMYFMSETPKLTTRGERIRRAFSPSFEYHPDLDVFVKKIENLKLPSPCTKLDGAYLNVIPGSSSDEVLLTVMPVDPKRSVSGKVKCEGQDVAIRETRELSIYRLRLKTKDVQQVF